MRRALVLAAVSALALGPLRAQPTPSPSPSARPTAELIAKMSVAAGALTAMSGELDVHYAPRGTFLTDHRARFWFAKPFRVRVIHRPKRPAAAPATPASVAPGAIDFNETMELVYDQGRAFLYQPGLKQVIEFDVAGSGPGDLLPRVFSLFTVPGFVQGSLLADVEAHFETTVEPRDFGWRLRLVTRSESLYRVALGIHQVFADVDEKSMLPVRLEIHDQGPAGPRLLCRVGLENLRFNQKLPAGTFAFRVPAGVRRVPSDEVLREWAAEALAQRGADALEQLQNKLENLRKNPWDF